MLKDLLRKKSDGPPDYVLLATIGILLAIGILILSSVSASFGLKRFGDTYYFLRHQLLFGLLPGLILGYAAFRMNLSVLRKWSPLLLFVALLLMIAVFLPFIGSKVGSSARWISLGSLSFQPSELLKLTFIIYLACWLCSKTEKKSPSFVGFSKTFVAFLAVLGAITALLYFQSDISTLMVIVSIAGLMYFSINSPIKHTLLLISFGMVALFLAIKFSSYRMNRFLVFLNQDLDPMGIGYQLSQSLIAVGSGGLTGVGLAMSAQKLGFLPQIISDSIFAVFAEETGFLGSVLLISLFLFFCWRGFKIIKQVPDKFLKLVALGIVFWIIIQTFVNIGAMIGILPLTGIHLPFVGYGGSAMVIELIAMGILLNISTKRA
ncbi:MAG: putative peptidoglycan glycosyltransferase FtsW [Candidatus Nealsonbacteria bacterium]